MNARQFRRPPLAAEVDERGGTAVVIDESHLLDHQEFSGRLRKSFEG